MSQLKMVTFNCRGLNNHTKRQKLFLWLEDHSYDIIFLQETFCTTKLEPYLKASWKGITFNAKSESSHSKGVSILLRKGFKYNIVKSHESDDGRIVIVSVELSNNLIHLVSVYAPNTEAERIPFFEKLYNLCIKHCDNLNNVVIGGDLNICRNLSDRYPKTNKKDKSIASFNNLLTKCKLIDLWQSQHGDSPGYTYFDKKNQSYSRLDYILVPEHFCCKLNEISICDPVKQTQVIDHSAIQVSFSLNTDKRGPGYWKINNSILSDEEYKNGVCKIIKDTKEVYKDLASHQLLWEIMKVNIKEYTILC